MENTGDTITYYVFGEEITERRENQAETQRLRETFNRKFNTSHEDIVIIMDMVESGAYDKVIDFDKYKKKRNER
jgi:hypothetical protein